MLTFVPKHLDEIVGNRADAGDPGEVGTDEEPELALEQRYVAGHLGKSRIVGSEIVRQQRDSAAAARLRSPPVLRLLAPFGC
jgi:hypothetical protein